jgi:hypothetical protein
MVCYKETVRFYHEAVVHVPESYAQIPLHCLPMSETTVFDGSPINQACGMQF